MGPELYRPLFSARGFPHRFVISRGGPRRGDVSCAGGMGEKCLDLQAYLHVQWLRWAKSGALISFAYISPCKAVCEAIETLPDYFFLIPRLLQTFWGVCVTALSEECIVTPAGEGCGLRGRPQALAPPCSVSRTRAELACGNSLDFWKSCGVSRGM